MLNSNHRRNRKGTKNADLWGWDSEEYPPLDGPLSVQEYIQELLRNDRLDLKRIIKPPTGVDVNVWQYEHMRLFVLELNLLVTHLHNVCTDKTCPKMETNGFPFTCTAHQTKQECCAIDYMTHNLDLASSILFSQKYFPSRQNIPAGSVKQLQTVARRLYRLFSHCFHRHNREFMEFEKEMTLCLRFTDFAKRFNLMPVDSFDIPYEALDLYQNP